MKKDPRNKSGYEKAVLLELIIARICAWVLYLAVVAVIALSASGIAKISFWQGVTTCLVLAWAAGMSARCEYKAEKQLKDIWEADGLERLVNG